MNPAGVIVTYIDWSDWKQWWFNIPLFLFQLTFMVVGTIYGKIKPSRGAEILGWFIDWAVVWRAAQASHVRLCLSRLDAIYARTDGEVEFWRYINFGYPKAEIQTWRPEMCDGKCFEYRPPTFDPTPQFIEAMIEYAQDQEGKRYDHLQLLSYYLNFLVWIFRWRLWGIERFKWLNLRGGRETCSSGVTACLRSYNEVVDGPFWDWIVFEGYGTAMVMPCMFVISENWKKI